MKFIFFKNKYNRKYMGTSCSSIRALADLTDEDNTNPKNKKEEILLNIRNQFKKMENYIYILRNEDVHYRMTKLISMLNSINQLNPIIKVLEESVDDFNYEPLEKILNNLFENMWKGNKDAFYDNVIEANEFFRQNNIPKLSFITPTSTPTPVLLPRTEDFLFSHTPSLSLDGRPSSYNN